MNDSSDVKLPQSFNSVLTLRFVSAALGSCSGLLKWIWWCGFSLSRILTVLSRSLLLKKHNKRFKNFQSSLFPPSVICVRLSVCDSTRHSDPPELVCGFWFDQFVSILQSDCSAADWLLIGWCALCCECFCVKENHLIFCPPCCWWC